MEISAMHLNELARELIITNSISIILFIILYYNYYKLKAQLEFIRSHHKLLEAREIEVLLKHFPYYKKLSLGLKRKFERRVAHFKFSKDYLMANGNNVDEKRKILIAAYSAQLTFGLNKFEFSHFKTVIIYQTKFYSNLEKEFRTWEVDPCGIILISWKDFYMSLKSNNGVSVPIGLRVMATVLQLENERRHQYDFNLSVTPDRIMQKQEQTKLFKTNDLLSPGEFTVACMVNFFERPNELKNEYPMLFKEIDSMLHRDVLKKVS